MHRSALDYDLPEGLIAQAPATRRDAARLLTVDAGRGVAAHGSVRDLPERLAPALVVVNDTRVRPARLYGKKASGGGAELLLVERLGPAGQEGAERWLALGRSNKGVPAGQRLFFPGPEAPLLEAVVGTKGPDGMREVTLLANDLASALERLGEVPLPPYVRRPAGPEDRERYQTIFARAEGAVAAPTAGLHFTPELVAAMEAAGHRFASVTLHVGPGTFQPVRSERLEDHPMHAERIEVPEATAEAIDHARDEGRRVLAIGTTVVRTLESRALPGGCVAPGRDRTDLFILPPYEAQVVDDLLTNFHLPGSTLLALVMALGGEAPLRSAYAAAVRERYRFFSYGDAMLLRGIR
ncbi:MAG: tRNA preQ1(34) S-adenosylmethionine ribosyltransferase-isomerase QueA [Myxococcota bacterium]